MQRKRSAGSRFIATCLLLAPVWPLAACAAACAEATPPAWPARCDMALKNGTFTEVVNVGSSRALVWAHTAGWRTSHPRHMLGRQHGGAWAANFHGQNHAIYQDVPIQAGSHGMPAQFVARFAVASPGNAGGVLKVFIALHRASGSIIEARSVELSQAIDAWTRHELALTAHEALPHDAYVRLAFQRLDAGGGGPLTVTDVTLQQSTYRSDR